MKKLTILICVLAILLGLAGIASASRPELGPFSTTGYTTNLVRIPDPPYLLPTEFEPLPSGHIKFHIIAQGGGEGPEDDALCMDLYGMPCQLLCSIALGQPCGVTDYFEGGTFSFEEWGIVDFSTGQGANNGIMTVATGTAQAQIRFDGQAAFGNVEGNFTVLRGTGEYKGLRGQGTYTGDAGYVFTVDYDPSGTGPCYASGDALKLKKKQAKWKLTNNGDDKITIKSITINWPESSGKLKKVKLGGKTIYGKARNSPWATIIDSDWEGKDKDRQIKKGKKKELKFEFEHKGSTEASDYTILVEFAEGCAACAVAFPPTP